LLVSRCSCFYWCLVTPPPHPPPSPNKDFALFSANREQSHSWLDLRFPALGTDFMFFSRLVHLFPALCNRYMFSYAWPPLPILSSLAPVKCFPALGTCYMFSRAWHLLDIYPRLASVRYLPTLGTCYMYSRAWQRLALTHFATSSHWLIGFITFTVVGQR